MKSHGWRGVAIVGMTMMLILSGAVALTPSAFATGPAGPEGTGVRYTVEPDGPTPLDDIVVRVTVSHEFCYSIDGIELIVSDDVVMIGVVATKGELCPAVEGPFETELPVPIGRLAAGTYSVDVSFSVCGGAACDEIGIGSNFDVVPVGDANCSSAVDSIDANIVLQSTAQLIDNAPCVSAADADRDGVVESIDATLILQYTAGLLGNLPLG